MAATEAATKSTEIIDLFKQYVVPNYRRYPEPPWRAAKARTFGTPTAIAISTSFPVNAAICWATVPSRLCEPFKSKWPR